MKAFLLIILFIIVEENILISMYNITFNIFNDVPGPFCVRVIMGFQIIALIIFIHKKHFRTINLKKKLLSVSN